ncbi:hypothetical protein HDF24_05550 [Mucilaginibacter sp. X4EP1]|uniref:hypothetical protein n=1 Tax=Mucilaginibacter sp. X4EP1 TaxID=2723092 RepID=UPI0021698C91|nr:hypothetical protein [Mucilaginibacter sp. X4EP1]MCS3814440.1 hypothetical protein [Mucilaginibacter sp. X4EP1]
MSNYRTIIIGCITAITFIATGIFLFKGFAEIYNKHKKYIETKEIVLNTDKMECVVDSIDHHYGLGVIAVYLHNGKRNGNNDSPPADLFVCRRYVDSLHTDTIMVLNTTLQGSLKLKYDISEYGVVFEPSRKVSHCRVVLPAGMIDSIQKYKYAYANLEFWIDD